MKDPVSLLARTAAEADLSALIQCDAYARSNEARLIALERWCSRGKVLVAEVAGEVIGFIVLEHSMYGHGFIPLVCVCPLSRRQGVAQFLLAQVECLCRTGKLFTSANASNKAAQALFQRAGFVRSGIIDNLDLEDPELVYFKPLSEHGA